IDGVAVPVTAILEFSQTYGELAQRSLRRTAANTAILRETGTAKLTTRIRGKGWAPLPLADLDIGTTHVLRCAMVRSVTSATNIVALPPARRSDVGHGPIGYALVGDEYVEAAVAGIVGDNATLTPVAGAIRYIVHYFPEVTAVITENTTDGNSDASHDWVIAAEEA
ncbi:MAG: hypothetical protein V2I76_08040, partial [Roseobacter sp.]|nr:hypothetical protein [Roseobacter sp.]